MYEKKNEYEQMGTKKFGYEQICVRKNWVQKNVGTKKKLVMKKN